MERALIEYAANAVWQLPLLAAGAWLLVRMARPGVVAQYRIWVGVLGLAVLLPLHGAFSEGGLATSPGAARVEAVPAQSAVVAGMAGSSGLSALDSIGEPNGLVLGALGVKTSGIKTRGQAWGAGQIDWGLSALERVRRVRLNATAAGWISGLYAVVMLLGLLRLALAWRTARRLARDSREMTLTDREQAVVEECARRMGVAAPVVRESRDISGPVVVGMTKPLLLWPEGFAGGLCAADREDEAMAALCHELAHIRRRDYLMNLVCEAAAVPLKWHPVTYGVERRIRSTREMVCDAMAAAAMESEMKYANCLLRLAESMVAGGAMAEQAGAVGLFNGNVLEERVMRLMQTKAAMSARARVARGVAGGAAMLATLTLAAMFHVVPAKAQTAVPTEAVPSAGVVSAAPVVRVEPKVVAPVIALTTVPARPPVAPPPPMVIAVPKVSVVAPVIVLATAPGVVAPVAALAPVPPVPAPQAKPAPEPPQPAPAPQAVPAPAPEPKKDGGHVRSAKGDDTGAHAWVDGQERELTPEERARLEKQLEDAQKKIAAEASRLNSPEFREQIEKAEQEAIDAQRKLQSGEIQKQLAETQKRLNSPEFKAQITEAQQKAMADVQKEMNSGEIQKQMADAQKQVAEAMAKLQSPEFKEQMEKAEREAMDAQRKLNSGEIQKQMAEAQKQLQQELEKLKAEQEETQKK